jgi:hypothetical protein
MDSQAKSQNLGSSDVSAQFNTLQIVTIKARTFCPAVDQQLLSKTTEQWLKSFIFATGWVKSYGRQVANLSMFELVTGLEMSDQIVLMMESLSELATRA